MTLGLLPGRESHDGEGDRDPTAVSAKFGFDFATGENSADPAKVRQCVEDLIPASRAIKATFVTWLEFYRKGLGVTSRTGECDPISSSVHLWQVLVDPGELSNPRPSIRFGESHPGLPVPLAGG